ncbi:LamG domain-containing protein [Candidatus Poribacteria bacterium]
MKNNLIAASIGFLMLLFASETAFSDLPMERLVAHWSFDEGNGKSVLDIVNGFKGDVVDAEMVDGRLGKALEFDGEGSYVSVPDVDLLKNFPEGLTVEAWVMIKGAIDEYSVVVMRKHPEYTLEVLGEMKARATVNGLWAEEWLTGKTILAQNEWYHLAMTCDVDTRKLYVSGQVEDEKGGVILAPSGDPLGIGKNVSQNMYFFPGIIDEVKIWDTALTADQLRESMERGPGPRAAEPSGKLSLTWGAMKCLGY